MTDAFCQSCAHHETRFDKALGTHDLFCKSPQVMAHQNRYARCIFERDTYDERRGDGPKRKCGPNHLNYVRAE